MLKVFAIVAGLLMVFIGALGFDPQAVPDGEHLFGIFRINTLHNIIYIAAGAISLLCGFVSEAAARLFFQSSGFIYALWALLGFYYMDEPILGLLANNMADNILHIILAAVALGLGYLFPGDSTRDSRDTAV